MARKRNFLLTECMPVNSGRGSTGLVRAAASAAASSQAGELMRSFFLLLVSFLCASALPAQDLPAGYAGTETCVICHEETGASFSSNPHHAIDTAERFSEWQGRGCESCHGAGAPHTESLDAADIFAFKGPQRSRVNETCLSCHTGDETHRGRLMGSHDRNGVDCLSCHGVHAASERPLLTAKSDALCSSCHVSERAAFNRPFRHRLQEQAIACVDCHNPHGGLPGPPVRRVSANEPVCLKCHADKRGPFPFEHAPVRLEPCSTCHEPHGSSNPRMLVRHDVSQLCLECHAGSLSTLGGFPPAFHDLRSARFQNCTVCHSKIHGSHVSRDLLR